MKFISRWHVNSTGVVLYRLVLSFYFSVVSEKWKIPNDILTCATELDSVNLRIYAFFTQSLAPRFKEILC